VEVAGRVGGQRPGLLLRARGIWAEHPFPQSPWRTTAATRSRAKGREDGRETAGTAGGFGTALSGRSHVSDRARVRTPEAINNTVATVAITCATSMTGEPAWICAASASMKRPAFHSPSPSRGDAMTKGGERFARPTRSGCQLAALRGEEHQGFGQRRLTAYEHQRQHRNREAPTRQHGRHCQHRRAQSDDHQLPRNGPAPQRVGAHLKNQNRRGDKDCALKPQRSCQQRGRPGKPDLTSVPRPPVPRCRPVMPLTNPVALLTTVAGRTASGSLSPSPRAAEPQTTIADSRRPRSGAAAGVAENAVQSLGDPRLRVVGGVLVVQGRPGRGVAGALHELGEGGTG